MQKVLLTSSVNIALKKVTSDSLTAGMLSRNFKQTLQRFIAKDKAYSFLKNTRGAPAYWKKFLLEVLAMVKQLGIQHSF